MTPSGATLITFYLRFLRKAVPLGVDMCLWSLAPVINHKDVSHLILVTGDNESIYLRNRLVLIL